MSQSNARRAGGRQVQRKKTNSNRNWIIAAVVGVVIIMVVAGLALSGGGGSGPTVGESIPDMLPAGVNPHIAEVTSPHTAYNSNPPTSGWHYGGGTAPWGIQTLPMADELTTHNLEHGGIVIHYRQGLDQAVVDQLTTVARQLQAQSPCIVLVPRPADKLTDTPIAVTAWTWMLKLQQADSAQITSFFKQHIDKGPEHVGCQLRS